MDSGRPGSHRLRFDRGGAAHFGPQVGQSGGDEAALADLDGDERLSVAVRRTRDYLLGIQHPDGHWVGELEGDTILESEFILLLAFLGQERSDRARRAAARAAVLLRDGRRAVEGPAAAVADRAIGFVAALLERTRARL